MSSAIPPREEGPAVLSMAPKILGLVVIHEDTLTGPVTDIVRRFDNPDLCHLCPRALCRHRMAGFCVVHVPDYVPDELCPTYSLAAQRATG
jgi:hypothetical protein